MTKNSRIFTRKEIISACCVTVVFIVAGLISRTDSMQIRLTRIVVMSLYAISLNIQYGYGGMANLGSSLYFAASGYVMLLFVIKYNWPLLLASIVALAFVLVMSLFFGYICLQRGQMTFVFLGMGLCILASQFAAKTPLLGGNTGLMGTVTPLWMASMITRYFFIFFVSLACGIILYLFTKSPLVETLKGVRENSERLLFLGVNVRKLQLIIFVITSFFMGIAGILFALLNNSVGIKTLDVNISLQALFMCIVGGASFFLGPVVGSVIVTLILTYVSSWTIYYNFVLGVIILLCIYLLPQGILGRVQRGKHR
jgi:branched-chain amino acid transport system permease protein